MIQPGNYALISLSAGLLGLLGFSLTSRETTQVLFIHSTYYFLLASVLLWAGTYLHGFGKITRARLLDGVQKNWPGLLLAFSITLVAAAAIDPSLRVLSDEANLLGTSKNLFADHAATFTVSGKYYYERFWNVDVAIDQRPTLFPFLVSLIHTALGYDYANAFVLNLLLLPAFLFLSYRLAKKLGGEVCGVVATLLVAAHPVLLICVRSAGFDFLAAFFSLLSVKSVLDLLTDKQEARRPVRLAIVWVNLCLLAEVRYESALFIAPTAVLLLAFRLVTWRDLRPYAFVYALTPAYLLPRFWQAILRGSVPRQEPGTTTFSSRNFIDNAGEYFAPLLQPGGSPSAHSTVIIALGLIGSLLLAFHLAALSRDRSFKSTEFRFGVFVLAWMSLQSVIVFSYVWGRAQYPSAARLVIALDVFFSFAAAWALTIGTKRWRPFVPLSIAVAIFLAEVPSASQAKMMSELTQTRESAQTWEFFRQLGERRILVVTDRPNHFTIMNYGAMNFDSARNDPFLFTALSRRLFQDVYVIQQVQLSTGTPFPGYEIWKNRKLSPVFEFQNDADVLIRISRLDLTVPSSPEIGPPLPPTSGAAGSPTE